MNLLKILDKLSDDKFFTTETSRSGTFSQISEFGKKAAIASIPLGLGSLMATSAKAETAATSSAALAPKKMSRPGCTRVRNSGTGLAGSERKAFRQAAGSCHPKSRRQDS